MWYIHTMEYFSPLKRMKFWYVVSERSKTKKTNVGLFFLYELSSNRQIHRHRNVDYRLLGGVGGRQMGIIIA